MAAAAARVVAHLPLALPPVDEVVSFVKEYYKVLNEYPEEAHKKYAETSKLKWPGSDEEGFVTTLSSINDKILSSDYKKKNWRAVVGTSLVPASHLGGVFVAVTGKLVDKEDARVVRGPFFQTFVLSVRQEKEKKKGALYILNDYLQVLDDKGEKAASAAPTTTHHPAEAFAREYYNVLNKSRERAHNLYAESSTRWPDHRDSVAWPVTTSSSIKDNILSSDYSNCSAEVVTLVVLESL